MFKTLRFAAIVPWLVLAAAPALAQANFPERTIRLVIGFPAGGGMDSSARIIAERLGSYLNQTIIVENQPGASGTLAATHVKNAEPDGYTIFLAEQGTFVGPVLYPQAAYDPIKDFAVIGRTGDTAMVLATQPSSPLNDLPAVIAAAKAEPGKLDYGSPGVGTVHHLAFEFLKKRKQLQITHVPYKGGAPILTALMAGEIPIGMVSLPAALPQAKAGKIKLIATTGRERTEFTPEIPTFSEIIPEFTAPSGAYLLAPAATPTAVLAILRDGLRKTLADQRVIDAYHRTASTIEAIAEGEDFSEIYAATVEGWSQIAKEIGAKAE